MSEDQAETPEPTEVEETVTEPASAPEAVVDTEEASGNTPWSSDLEKTFEDESVRGSVDEFLRTKIQPYITQLEAAKADNESAVRLFEDFQSDPFETYAQITKELFEDDVADEVLDFLVARFSDSDETEDVVESEGGDEEPDGSNLPPEVQEFVEQKRAEKQAEAYEAHINTLRDQFQEPGLTTANYAAFYISAKGDDEVAIENWRKARSEFSSISGLKEINTSEVAAAVKKVAPKTLGSDTAGGSTPPLVKKPKDIDAALNEMMSDFHKSKSVA